ncbi:DUF6747 family protein [Robiginitalea sp.]|uniref:DUF6747 family protein n=1 Tax=Robiginitalea sp. TaxID=1902411 RepID=UPI003C548F5B
MKTIYLLRAIYLEAFRSLGNYLVRHSLKVFAWFCFALILIALYAFLFRVSTGFAFV